MDKSRNNQLIRLADQALNEQTPNLGLGVTKILNGTNIDDAYNGSIAALSVSVAIGELCPALAIYYQDKPNSNDKPKANRRSVLDVIARIITKDDNQWDFSDNGAFAKNMFRYAIGHSDDKELKKEVIDCAIALKQIVRTYNLVKTERS